MVRGHKDYHVVDLPLAMNHPAHVGMNKRNADQRDDEKEAAKDHAELDCCQAVHPVEEPSPHGSASGGLLSRQCGESDIRFDPAPVDPNSEARETLGSNHRRSEFVYPE